MYATQYTQQPLDARDVKIKELEQRLAKLEALFVQLKEHTAPDLKPPVSEEDLKKQAYNDLVCRLTIERLKHKKALRSNKGKTS